MMRRNLLRPLWVILALLFLLEAWLWDHLAPIIARVVNLVPWGKIKIRLSRLVEDLPPYFVLIVFTIPIIVVLLPLKFLEVYFIATNSWWGVITVLVVAKLLGLGMTAFVFDVTRDKLLQIGWFHRMYDWFIWLRGWAHSITEPVREQLRQFRSLFTAQRAGPFMRLLMRLRRKAFASPANDQAE
jgi:hypothetical protein